MLDAMLEALLPKSATRVVVYLQPINVRWGAKKLGTFCREVVRVEPDDSTCFLLVNSRRDTLLMYAEAFRGPADAASARGGGWPLMAEGGPTILRGQAPSNRSCRFRPGRRLEARKLRGPMDIDCRAQPLTY
ncbi:MAG: hypothetical protein RL685_7375 [Pseudomonadota bacterium]|jgi:hypothetical protein